MSKMLVKGVYGAWVDVVPFGDFRCNRSLDHAIRAAHTEFGPIA